MTTAAMITLEINGATRSIPAPENLRALVRYLGVGEERVAVELNRHIIRRRDWDATVVADCDKVEIVQFVGGG